VIRVTCSFGHGGIPPYTFVLRNRVLLANVPEEDTSFFRSDSRSRLGCLPIWNHGHPRRVSPLRDTYRIGLPWDT
jgi:hypothetical protein